MASPCRSHPSRRAMSLVPNTCRPNRHLLAPVLAEASATEQEVQRAVTDARRSITVCQRVPISMQAIKSRVDAVARVPLLRMAGPMKR